VNSKYRDGRTKAMGRRGRDHCLTVRITVLFGAIPVLIFASASGPDPRFTAAPGDYSAACTSCHSGPAVNGGGGSVSISSQAGASYSPGRQQAFTITVNDSQAKVYGLQVTARIDSQAVLGQAGDFTAGAQQIVLCDDGTIKETQGCPSYQSVEFLEQSSPISSNTISVIWTAPPANVGTVTLYVAAIAGNGDGDDTGDRTYTASLQLCPGSACAAPPPGISPGRVTSASGFSSKAGCAPGTWLEIYGTNLSTATRTWAASDFKGANAPTSLGNVTVSIGGVSAYVNYVSPAQVNVQVPDAIPIGSNVPLIVTSSGMQSAPYMLQTTALAPALLAPNQAPFNVNGKQYVAAQLADQSFSGIPTRTARPGDVLAIYGIGFGPVTPDTPAGTIAPAGTTLKNPVTFQIGQAAANVVYRGLTPGIVGLYQFNIVVPNVSPGDYALTVQVGGVQMAQSLLISVGN